MQKILLASILFAQMVTVSAYAEKYCPTPWALNGKLCVKGSEALGPFTRSMTLSCKNSGGGNACNGATWNVNLANRLAGLGACLSGANQQSNGLCIEDADAFGPFETTLVQKCLAGGNGGACKSMRIQAILAQRLTENPGGGGTGGGAPASAFPWSYFAGKDNGVRVDDNGAGWFRASRGGGTRSHAGIDYLMEPGTPLYSPCNGYLTTSQDPNGYGNYVVVSCQVPSALTDGDNYTASMVFGHLSRFARDDGSVSRGQLIGYSGRSGNASGGGVTPHVHFDISIEDGFNLSPHLQTMDEAESDNLTTQSLSRFIDKLNSNCKIPNGFWTNDSLTYGSHVDPFAVMTCLSRKPTLRRSQSYDQFNKWNEFYSATGFDVNVGLPSPLSFLSGQN